MNILDEQSLSQKFAIDQIIQSQPPFPAVQKFFASGASLLYDYKSVIYVTFVSVNLLNNQVYPALSGGILFALPSR